MTNKKKTLYEILAVSPNAALPDIQAAHKLLSRQLVSGKLGLSREEIEFELKVIDVALHTLSSQSSRDAYDAELASPGLPANMVSPSGVNALSLRPDTNPLAVATALEDHHKIAALLDGGHEAPLKLISSTVSGTTSALKKILRAIIFLSVLGSVIQIISSVSSGRRMSKEAAQVEEKLYIQEYYQKHGVRVGSKAEAVLLETESRRAENEQRAAALDKQRQEESYNQFIDDSYRTGDQISEDVRRDEERARYEEAQKQQQLEEEQRRQDEAAQEEENARVEEAKRNLGLQ